MPAPVTAAMPPLDRALLRRLRFSAATAAFQIEGARTQDRRDRSIWDDFVDSPGRVRDAATADPGPDSYHRAAEDVALLARLGVDEYRFSISWVRVLDDGRPNPRGLAYYDRLVDRLLDAGIMPTPTLYHWDLPSRLEEDGGWLSRSTAERFAQYAEVVADALGDRVRSWYTINEPVSTTLQGYAIGELAPGRTLLFDALPTVHHQLLAHGYATRILHAHGATSVGIVNNHTQVLPASGSEADLQAAFLYDLVHNRMFADPVLLGDYPSAYVMLALEQPAWQEVQEQLQRIPEVEHMALVGGDFDVILLVRASDARDLRRIVLEDIQAISAVRSTRTTLIFEDFDQR